MGDSKGCICVKMYAAGASPEFFCDKHGLVRSAPAAIKAIIAERNKYIALERRLAEMEKHARVLHSNVITALADLVKLSQPEGVKVKWRNDLIDRERVVEIVMRLRREADAAATAVLAGKEPK